MYLIAIPAYLLGSIPSGILVARAFGLNDPRAAGSGNIGAANLTRLGGKKAGVVTFIFDFLKGMVPVVAARVYAPENPLVAYAAALFAVTGHCYSIFLLFKGGKGVATMAGSFAALAPIPMGLAFLVWALVFYTFRITSIAAMGALCAFLYFLSLTSADLSLSLIAILSCLMVVRRHKSNLSDFLTGQERRF